MRILDSGGAEVFCNGCAHLSMWFAMHVQYPIKPSFAKGLGIEAILNEFLLQQVARFCVPAYVPDAIGVFFNTWVILIGTGDGFRICFQSHMVFLSCVNFANYSLNLM